MAEAATLARDLINTPSNDMGPEELAQAAQELASASAPVSTASSATICRDRTFPLIHAVGMASPRAPRLIDFSWGDPAHPKVTLVGKGVCFDTGGLDIKPSSGMLIMKKDMGGAANVLALALMVMDAAQGAAAGADSRGRERGCRQRLPPARHLRSRKGLTVEIGNTDAEGRLVLADALALADEEKPDLLIDLGTLTGAARVALGPDLPPFYTNDETLARTSRAARSRRTIRCGECRCGRPTIAGSIPRSPTSTTRRRAALPARSPRAVPAPLRRGRQKLAACRYLRLDAIGQAGPARGRRMPGRARDLQMLSERYG